jgi:hypothetical protein
MGQGFRGPMWSSSHEAGTGTQTTRGEESPRAAITGMGRPRPKRLRYNQTSRTGKCVTTLELRA